MATAALVSPGGSYHSHHSSFSSGYPHSAPATSIPGMILPVDSHRRTSDDLDQPHRQSLPSISEVISGTKSASYAPPLSQGPIPQNQGLPSPFSTTAPPRPFGDVGSDKNPSPRTLQPPSSYPRADTLPAFSDPARPALPSRPAPPPPLNTFPGRHPSPPVKLEQHEAEQRHAEAQQQYSAGHQHQQGPPPSNLYSPTPRPPPGQLPLPQYPVSPRHNGPALPSPFEARPPIYGDERDHGHREGEYRSTLDKAFESWGYSDSLNTMTQIATSSRTVAHFAEAYIAAAREQQGAQQPIPSRLPTESEVNAMINTSLHALQKLEEIREIIQQHRISVERARENGGRKGMEEEDVPMYGDGMKQGPYNITEVKKRRGRAAPPGRCHSCNRIDTPEWRRGPDGARTLCNACGLHYAKLERRRQLDQRSGRPKTADERS
ncbi:hypothetical protein B0T25DRAFT_121980 [Lasiosphaeria hispida]|uniref:GATA-type domain-containing protein n=1 Tax=Lasiosphaeria hispida TaxID=260671 RepID=A0AAJ0HRJ4_9PEZI|nr:hypothetical protein B0T25DRAFT_121980 [Lasiosphaeria hispida]